MLEVTVLTLRRVVACVALVSGLVPATVVAQNVLRRDVIQGTVTTDSGAVIAGADVIVTMAPDRVSQGTKTDPAGHYSLVFAQGTGDYLVHVSATGWQTFRKRVTRTGADSVFTVDAKLTSTAAVQQLAAVRVNARKPKPGRRAEVYGTETGAAERLADGVNGAVPPDQAGDLAATAATVPGVALTPNGISVGGLSPAQNSTTLNGMSFAGADVPRDARTTTRVSSSTYDPARGWFSGANVDVSLAPGNIFSGRTAHFTVDAPPLQYTDPVSASMGQRFTGLRASTGGDGPLLDDRFEYNYGIDAARRSSDFVSLDGASPLLLARAGVAADSAARLESLLRGAGVPLRASGVPSARISESASLIGRIDHAPYDWDTFTPAPTSWGVLGYAKLGRSDAVGMLPVATASHGGSTTQQIGMLQLLYSSYTKRDWLTEARSTFTMAHDAANPYVALPGGRVLVASDIGGGEGGIASLAFGGNGALLSDQRRWTWETMSETQFYRHGRPAHRVNLTADARLDGVRQNPAADRLGTFAFNSLGDLEANAPASFTRTLTWPARTGGVWNGFVAVSDAWRKSQTLQLMYGARLEGNRYLDVPANNPAVEAAFGIRTDRAPNTLHLSPRLGFTWLRPGKSRDRSAFGTGYRVTQLGQFFTGPTSYVRGGIGEFRSFLGPDLLTGASVATGLPNGSATLTCVGAATPSPDWRAYDADPAAIPRTCANGAASVLSDAAPSVQAFSPTYTAARSWRANLAYGSSFHHFTYTLEGLYSRNVNQPGRVDLNFTGTPQFTLADEGRPVFVTPGSIVPGTGATSTVEARRSAAFGHVVESVSDLHSSSRQLTLTVTPEIAGPSRYFFTAGYTLAKSRAEQSGFDASTFGSPVARGWSRGDLDIRHQLLLQGGMTIKQVALTFFGRIQSGLPFTPMVGGDVNGDGYANDRAFVFDPARSSDTATASGMRALLASASPRVRDCLVRQLGAAAGRNSCEGPWTASLNAQLSWRGAIKPLHRGGSVALAFANPLGGLDQLIHGSDHLHGWGTQALPDPVLVTPHGFDPAARRFQYAVNPRFGSTNPANTLLRVPFRVTLDVSLDIGATIPEQQIDRWLKPGRGHPGAKLSAAELARRYRRNVPDPYAEVLEESDSLLISRDQADSLKAIDARFRQRTDSIWNDLSTYLAALGDDYDAKAALARQEKATDAAWELARTDVQRELPHVLSPVQLTLLPGMVNMLYTARQPLHIRMFVAGG